MKTKKSWYFTYGQTRDKDPRFRWEAHLIVGSAGYIGWGKTRTEAGKSAWKTYRLSRRPHGSYTNYRKRTFEV